MSDDNDDDDDMWETLIIGEETSGWISKIFVISGEGDFRK